MNELVYWIGYEFCNTTKKDIQKKANVWIREQPSYFTFYESMRKTGFQASIDKIVENKPSLIIVDAELSDSGEGLNAGINPNYPPSISLGTIKELRKNLPNIPILVSYFGKHNPEDYIKKGASEVIPLDDSEQSIDNFVKKLITRLIFK